MLDYKNHPTNWKWRDVFRTFDWKNLKFFVKLGPKILTHKVGNSMSFALSKIMPAQFREILRFGVLKNIQQNPFFRTFSTSLLHFSKESSRLSCRGAAILDWEVRASTLKTSLIGFGAIRLFSAFTSMINQQNYWGDTPLHLGVKMHRSNSRYEICKILLEKGANPNIPDFKGKTPLDTAIEQGSQDMIELLTFYGALQSNTPK